MMMRLTIFAAMSFIGVCAAGVRAGDANDASSSRLWYKQPAAKWTEALPIGNGRLGAMVFGGIADERIQFNEDTLWTGKPHDYAHPDAAEHLAELRKLIADGKDKEAAAVLRDSFLSIPVRQRAYQPFGDLHLHFPGHEQATDYRRELDLNAGVARVSYRVNGVTHERQIFAGFPDQVIVLRITADRPGQVGFKVKMDSPHKISHVNSIGGYTIVLTGQVQDPSLFMYSQKTADAPKPPLPATIQTDGVKFESRLRVIAEGGKVTVADRQLNVENADAVTLVLAAATSFKNFQDITADPAARCEAVLAKVDGKSFDALLAAHTADHRRLFQRVSLNLGRTEQSDLPTDERLKRIKKDGLAADPALVALHFQYGRYLLMASSRPGSQAATLQGVWNESLDPPWDSKYTTNINLEMNYWPAEPANLAECHEPLFDLIDDCRISGHRTAKINYNARGWVLHHNTDIWRGTAPINNIDGQWPTGGAWLCSHLWEHYQFTGDREFLARRAYPAMKEACEFFLDFLTKDTKTGWLVSTPSYSPEQGNLTAGPSMDHQIIRALFDSTIEAGGILAADPEFITRLADARRQLAPDQIGKSGQLQEWLMDVDKPNNKHRHMSPLWCLYPGAQYTPFDEDPKFFDAAKVLLKWRGEGSTGWSYAWRIPLWARVGDGDFAFSQLNGMLDRKTLPNLMDLCGPFQIDGNFGATAGIAEMLLQSHARSSAAPRNFIIQLLPALPKAWPTGSVTGLCARGGLEVDIVWEAGTLLRANVRSKLGGRFQVRYGDRAIDLSTEPGKQYALDGRLGLLK
jgi:alpha-L-fucosidase 2